jgi:hypothetical protein
MNVPVSRDEIFQQLRQLLLDQFELRPEQVVPKAHLAQLPRSGERRVDISMGYVGIE